jgi:hypothetical protein
MWDVVLALGRDWAIFSFFEKTRFLASVASVPSVLKVDKCCRVSEPKNRDGKFLNIPKSPLDIITLRLLSHMATWRTLGTTATEAKFCPFSKK